MKASASTLLAILVITTLFSCSPRPTAGVTPVATLLPSPTTASAQPTSTITELPTPTITELPMPTIPLGVPSQTPLSASGLTGRITYSHEGDVYAMDADGSHITQLTTDPAEDFDSAWSPDGTQIAFRSHRDGAEEVYRMNADGSDQRNLTNAPSTDYSPAWSPDGKWIAFMSDRTGNSEIWVMHPDGSNPRQVTDIPGISEYPTWSPDSRKIAFHCTFGHVLPGGSGDFEICIVNLDGTGLKQITNTPGENKLPAWSPDGSKIAFQSNRNGWPTLPDYTPLGYDPNTFGDFDVYVMDVDGSNQVNLTNNPREDETFPAWSRDGWLIFTRYGCLMALQPGSASLVKITHGSCAGLDGGQFPDWFQPIQ